MPVSKWKLRGAMAFLEPLTWVCLPGLGCWPDLATRGLWHCEGSPVKPLSQAQG